MHDSSLDRLVVLHEPYEKNPPRSFIDYLSRPFLVLLGDPGIGKTHTFKMSSKYEDARYMSVRSFLAVSGMGCEGYMLYLDGLDEYRTRSDGNNLLIDLIKCLSSLNLAGLRISCRAADWFGDSDLELFKAYFGSNDYAVLALQNLVNTEIVQILDQTKINNPEDFLVQAENRGLDSLLGNPQTLLMLSDLVCSENWPSSRTELFEKSAIKLLSEHEVSRTRSGLGLFSADELFLPAGAVFCSMLVSDINGISLFGDTQNVDYPSYREVTLSKPELICAALTRRVFEQVDMEKEAFSYTHRTIAEFLAASWMVDLVKKGYPIRRFISLISIDGYPATELRGLYAWFTTLLPDNDYSLIDADPLGIALYGDASNFDTDKRIYLLEALQNLSKEDPLFRLNSNWANGALGSLSGVDMIGAFSDILKSKDTSFHLKDLVLSAIKSGPRLPQLESILLSIVRDGEAHYSERSDAIDILIYFGGTALNSVLTLYHNNLGAEEDDLRLKFKIVRQLNLDYFNLPNISNLLYQFSIKDKDNTVGTLWAFEDILSEQSIPVLFENMRADFPIKKDYYDYSSPRREIADLMHALIKKFLLSKAVIDITVLWEWLLFANSFESHDHMNRDGSFLSDWLSSNKGLKYCLFKSAFNSWEDDFNWNDTRIFSSATFSIITSQEWIDFGLDLLFSQNEITQKHATLFTYIGHEIIRTGYSEYVRFGRWLSLSDTSLQLTQKLDSVLTCPLEDWRVEDSKRRKEYLKKKEQQKHRDRKNLITTKDSMRRGEHVHNLAFLAENYFSEIEEGLDPLTPLLEMAGNELLEYISDGFVNYFLKGKLPTSFEIGRLGNTRYRSWYIVLAAMDEFKRRNIGLSELPDDSLETALAISFTLSILRKKKNSQNYSEQITLPWVTEIISLRPDLVEKCIEQLSRGGLEVKSESNNGLDALRRHIPKSTCKRKLVIGLLNDFPNMRDRQLSQLIESILEIECPEREDLLAITNKTLSARSKVKGKQRAIWLIAGFILSPHEYANRLKKYAANNPWVIWEVSSLVWKEQTDSVQFSLSCHQLEFLAVLFAKNYPNIYRSVSVETIGYQYSWDAAEIVRGMINKISSISSNDASLCLERMMDAKELETYRNHIAHNKFNQLRMLRETLYRQPTWRQAICALSNNKPANSSDLYALVIDHLEQLKQEIRQAPTSIFKRFWRHGVSGKLVEPDIEDFCRDRLIDLLKPRLAPLALRVEPEGHMADDKRADIVVYPPPGLKLPLELKRDFHPDVWTALLNQLECLYTRDPEASGYGIYVVFWFGEMRKVSFPNPPKGFEKPKSAIEMEIALNTLIPKDMRNRLIAFVIDVSGSK